MMMNQG